MEVLDGACSLVVCVAGESVVLCCVVLCCGVEVDRWIYIIRAHVWRWRWWCIADQDETGGSGAMGNTRREEERGRRRDGGDKIR